MDIKEILSFIESYFVTNVEADGTRLHHIDDIEWQSLKSKLARQISTLFNEEFKRGYKEGVKNQYEAQQLDEEEIKRQERERIEKQFIWDLPAKKSEAQRFLGEL